ncbi:hypothetical protein [Nocardia sp. GAS34]|uniref:hypothetical protein n=1 Tax=unclassified Nocardia TaxID=2637762 RepID=UPI003D1DA6EA
MAPTLDVGAGYYPRSMLPATALVADLLEEIVPLDALEREHIDHTRAWLTSTDYIFRRVISSPRGR